MQEKPEYMRNLASYSETFDLMEIRPIPGEHSLNRIWLPVDLKNVGAPERATPVFP